MRTLFDTGRDIEIAERYQSDADVVLFEGDCKELLEEIPSDSVDLVITSPPYNIGKIYERKTSLRAYLEHQESVIAELYRTLSSTGSICWEIGNYIQKGEVFPEVWDIPNVKANHPEKTIHPCQFPIELVERCTLALTNDDGVVLDPYCGVGTTIITALKHNRKAIAAEQDKEYVDIARDRLQRFIDGTLPIRPLGKPVHTPTGKEKVVQRPLEWGNSTKEMDL